jgi:hypothetical protein
VDFGLRPLVVKFILKSINLKIKEATKEQKLYLFGFDGS